MCPVVKCRIPKPTCAERAPYKDERRPSDLGLADLISDRFKRSPNDVLIRPSDPVDNRDWAISAIDRFQCPAHGAQVADRKVDRQRRTRLRECFQFFAGRHG